MKLQDYLQDLIFTPRCLFCGKYLGLGKRPLVCEECYEKFSAFNGNCARCGSEFSFDCGLPVCHTCKSALFAFDGVVSAYRYKSDVRKAIVAHKYNFFHNNAKTLSYHISKIINDVFRKESADYIIPVPPDKNRLTERGYDPTLEICEAVSEITGLPVLKDNLVKIKSTHSQSLMSRSERMKNLKGAFTVKDKEQIKNKNIILFDDVFTTGSTCTECAKILKKAGASYVLAATVSITDKF